MKKIPITQLKLREIELIVLKDMLKDRCKVLPFKHETVLYNKIVKAHKEYIKASKEKKTKTKLYGYGDLWAK